MRKVRLGVIGIGNMGAAHCRSILEGKTPDVELTAVADSNEKRRVWAREEFPQSVQVYADNQEMMRSGLIDAVLIATPHYDHPSIAMEAFAHKIHVLCEKPAGVYAKAVRQMNEAAAKSDVVFAIMYNQRTNAIYRKMHEIMQSGEMGEFKRVVWLITDWFRSQFYYDSGAWRATWNGEGGGVLLNQCPHNLDLLQWLCGMPSRVKAHCHEGKWHDIEVEDDVTAYLEFSNGATGVFVTTTGEAPGTNRLEISCENGKLLAENGKLMLYKNNVSDKVFSSTIQNNYEAPKAEICTVETDGENPQHVGVINAFASAILRGTPLVAAGEEGINGLALSNAMHLSSWLDKTVSVPADEDLFLEELNKRRAVSRIKTEESVYISTEGSYGS